jgi:hypothetical protein
VSRNWIIGIIALVVVLIIFLAFTYRQKLFAAGKNKTKKDPSTGDVVIIQPGTSVFPLAVGSYNIPEVGKLQNYLINKGCNDCNGQVLTADEDFGPKTECAVITCVSPDGIVTEAKYKSLGL